MSINELITPLQFSIHKTIVVLVEVLNTFTLYVLLRLFSISTLFPELNLTKYILIMLVFNMMFIKVPYTLAKQLLLSDVSYFTLMSVIFSVITIALLTTPQVSAEAITSSVTLQDYSTLKLLLMPQPCLDMTALNLSDAVGTAFDKMSWTKVYVAVAFMCMSVLCRYKGLSPKIIIMKGVEMDDHL